MLSRFIFSSFLLMLITIIFVNNFATANEGKDNAQAYINYAINHQKSNPDAANKALEQAYNLAKQQNNKLLAAKAVLEQAQTAKIQKNYRVAHQYLIKAEALSSSLNDVELSVNVLINLSTTFRYLKKYEESMDYAQQGLALAHESGESNLILNSLQVKGKILQNMKRYDESITAYLLAQRYISGTTNANKLRLLRDTANAYSKINEYDSSIRYYNKAIHFLEDINDIKSMPKTLVELAKTQSKMGRFSLAIENGKRSLALSREYKLEPELLKSLVGLSIVYRKISSYEQALSHGLEAIDIYQRNNDFDGLAASANSIGLVYLHLAQTESAKSYFNQVLSLPVNKVKAKYRAAALRGLGKLLSTEKQYKKGFKLSSEAHDLYEKTGDRNGAATVQKNLGYIYYKMARLNDSIHAYNISIALFKKIKDVWNVAESKAQLSIVLADVDIIKSIALAQDSLASATKIGAKSVAEQAYSALILAEEKRQDYKQALAYAKRKEALINEIKTDAINKRSAEMYIILDVEKKERAFDILKQEKAVILLELNNQESAFRLLEKEKIIHDLQAKNNLIIVSVIIVFVIIGLLVLGRVYFNMCYTFIISAIVIVILLFFSVSSHSTDIIKLTRVQSTLDVRPKYTHLVLKEALELSSDKYGPYEIIIIDETLTNDVKMWEVYDGTHINLTMAMTSPDWEYLTLPIRIPIRRGIGSYRLLAINKNNQHRFTEISSLEQLKSLMVGLQKDWIMNDLLEEEGFKIVEISTYDGTFKMLNKNRFDFIPRGINEVYDELSLREDNLKNLMIEPTLALHIPQPYYMFVSPKYPKIAERLEYGLEIMVAKGTLQKMFDEHYADFIKMANLSNRTIINIDHKYLTQKTPLGRKELWLNFEFEK